MFRASYFVILLFSLISLSVAGCSTQTREAMKQDVNKGMQEVDRAFTH
jgi:predicted small secreted protein